MKTRGNHRLMPRTRIAGVALALAALGSAPAWVGCGGTTGREGLAALGALDASPGTDATITPDASLADADEAPFDVAIPYADRVLPDVTSAPDAGALDWPTCPEDLATAADGGWTDPAHGYPAFPAEYDDAGHPVPAPDGSVCATHVWLGRREWDDCVRGQEGDTTLPPCAYLGDAGKATAGPGSGESLRSLCQELSQCIARSGCGLSDVNECLCGAGNGEYAACRKAWVAGQRLGACWKEELAALQVPDTADAVDNALPDFNTIAENDSHAVAGRVNNLYVIGKNSGCFAPVDAGTD